VKGYRTVLLLGGQIVGFVLACYGGVLTKIAPPSLDPIDDSYTVGVVSVFLLVALLGIAAFAKTLPGSLFRRTWIFSGGVAFTSAVIAAFLYLPLLDRYTWSYPSDPPVRLLRANEGDFTPDARTYLAENPHALRDPYALLRKFDSLEEVWTRDSLNRTHTRLLVGYLWLVTSIGAAIFCLLEANAGSAIRRKKRVAP
jgi:hypothetical protein